VKSLRLRARRSCRANGPRQVELIAAGTDIDYEGAGGPLDFDAAGDVDGIIVEVVWENGAFVEKGPVQ
jgi:branched-chain amino acid transport system substrate-binding protein